MTVESSSVTKASKVTSFDMARLSFSFLVAVVIFAVASWAQLPPPPLQFIPTIYVTTTPERPSPDEAVMYVADICEPKSYAPYMVIVRVNIPQGWRPYIGVLAKLEVCTSSSCDTLLCSNYVKGFFNGQHNCSFAYNTTLQNIYIRTTAGPAPNIDWTVALEFLTKRQYLANRVEDVFYYDIPEPKALNEISPNDVKVLAQIVPPGVERVVTTLNRLDFSLTFCPTSQTTKRYNVNVVVTALDSRSALATYVCLPPLPAGGCTPTAAKHSDPRGIGVNVITLQTGSGTLKNVYVVVVGWGDGEQTNRFMISATISKY